MTINKNNFLGGLQQQFDSAKSQFDTTHRLLVNGRVRRGTVKPVRAPVEITASLPTTGNVQGLYDFDTYLLVFIDGRAYVRQMLPESPTWTAIADLQMSITAAEIYVELVPESTVNLARSAGSSSANVNLGSPVAPSPQCLIVCDGVTQPWIVFADGGARVTKTYSQWNTDDREYVPVMKFPTLVNGILYGVMSDSRGKFTQIVRSVSGRPLDFMVVIDPDGLKVSPVEATHGAKATATNVSFAELTALKRINGVDGAFLACTLRSSFLVIPDYDRLIFGEHQWRQQFLFNIGAISPFAIADMLGDTAVVYPGGIRTFNGVAQSKFEGKNAPLSQAIQDLLGDTNQITAAAVEFDNYVGFGVNTVHGPGIVWWDSSIGVFVAFDSTFGVGAVKQFASVVTPTRQRLFFRTESGKIYEAFAGEPQRVTLALQELPCSAAEFTAVRVVMARFIRCRSEGYAQLTAYSAGRAYDCNANLLPSGDVEYSASRQPIPAPIAITLRDETVVSFEPEPDMAGRVMLALSWDADAELSDLTIELATHDNKQQNPEVDDNPQIPTVKVVFVGNDAVSTTARIALNSAIQLENADYVIGLGGHTTNGTRASVEALVDTYWGNIHNVDDGEQRFYAVPGGADFDVSLAEPLHNWLRQSPERYSKLALGQFAEVYLMADGLNSSGTQTEPDNSPTPATGPQAEWLRTQLDNSDAHHKIVVWHTAPRTSASGAYPGNTALNAIDIDGATALITAGPNFYERLVGSDDFVPRFVVGTGGKLPLAGTNSAVHSDSQKIVNDTLGYLVAVISPLSIEFTFKDANGNVRDRYRV
jgi:hypothetical protein